jgi:transcription elongation factor Elf1
MRNNVKPIDPVKPSAMELIFVYSCPFCGYKLNLLAPTAAAIVQCGSCGKQFPIVPVESNTVNFVKIMLDNGKSAIDADYM